MALISSHPLNIANKKIRKDLERLSSAYRINRAGDGPAELAVSQSMRADIIEIKSLKKNAKDGISLVQTAEGALAEVHDMLNRLVELSDQSANGTYEDSDRASLQSEVDQLKSELDRIAASANYNGIPLLNGDLAAPTEPEEPPLPPYTTENNIAGVTAKAPVQTGATWEGTFDASELRDGMTLTINGVVFEFDNDNTLNTAGAVQVKNGANGLQAAIMGSSLGGTLQSCTVANLSGSTFKLELEQNAASAEDGKGFHISFGNSLPTVTHDPPQVDNDIPGVSMVRIDKVSDGFLADGAVIELFGKKYELDYDNVYSTSSDITRINLVGVSDAAKYSTLMNELNNQVDVSTNAIVAIAIEADGTYTFDLISLTGVTLQHSDIRFNAVQKAPPPVSTVVSSQNGVNRPAVPAQNALRTDSIDFSRLQEGDAISINGYVFELDSDGVTATAGHIPVDISSVTKPSEIANMLKAAFDAQGFPNMSIAVTALGNDEASITVTSALAVEGEKMIVKYIAAPPPEEPEEETGLYLQVGPGQTGGLRLNLDSMTVNELGISEIRVDTAADAELAIDLLRKAVNKVSSNRGTLGAVHNRLEHTYNNLSVAHENLSDAEDRIASADMGEEMANFTKDQIVAQAAQSMLAQSKNLEANQIQQLLQF